MKRITTDDLRRMDGMEGLVLQGCGGDLREWVDGVNDMLTEAGILKDGSRFDAQAVSAFQHDGCTNLLFPLDGSVKLNVGKLAAWRLMTHEQFGGTWLSDYVPNRLGGFTRDGRPPERGKPLCPLIGQDGNVFHLLGVAAKTLRENGMEAEAGEMTERVMGGDCHSYAEALSIITEYVEPTDGPAERAAGRRKKVRKPNAR